MKAAVLAAAFALGAAQTQIPATFTNVAAALGLLVNGQPPQWQPQTLPATYDPSSDPCYGFAATASLNQGLCGSDFAQSAALTMSINLCRSASQFPNTGAGYTATRVSPQYFLSIARYINPDAPICSGGSVAEGAFQPFVNLKTNMAVTQTLRRAIPVLSCNASDPLELCSGGCSPYQEAVCTLDDPSEQGAKAAIPDVAVTQCPNASVAFSATQCANTPQGWLDADSNRLTVQSAKLGATYVSIGPAAGMSRGVTLSPSRGAIGYPLWTEPDVLSMKAFLLTYGAATVAMSACLSWQSWMSGCLAPPHAIDGRAGLCLYREPLQGSRFNSSYGLYTLPLNPSLASQSYGSSPCPAASSIVSATLLGWKTVGGVESWILRGNWGSGLGVGGDFFIPIAATIKYLNGSVAMHYPESLLFYPNSGPFPVSAQAAYPAVLPVQYDPQLRAGVQALGFQPGGTAGEDDSDAPPYSGVYFNAAKVEPGLTATVVRAAFNAVGETQQTSALVLGRVFKNDCRVISGGYFCNLTIDVLDLSSKVITRWYAGAVKRLILSDALSAVAGLGSTAGVTIVSLQASTKPVTDLSPLTAMGSIGDLGNAGSSLYTDGEKKGLTVGIVIVALLASAVLVVAIVYVVGRLREIYQQKKLEKQREQAMELVAGKAGRYTDNPDDDEENGEPDGTSSGSSGGSGSKRRGSKTNDNKKGGRAKDLHANVAAVASETDAAELLRVEKELASGGFLGILPAAASTTSTTAATSSSSSSKGAPSSASKAASSSSSSSSAAAAAAPGDLPGGASASAFDDDEEEASAAAAEQAKKEAEASASGKIGIGGDSDEDDEASAGSASGDKASAGAGAAAAPSGTVVLANPSSTTVKVSGDNTLVYGKRAVSKRVI